MITIIIISVDRLVPSRLVSYGSARTHYGNWLRRRSTAGRAEVQRTGTVERLWTSGRCFWWGAKLGCVCVTDFTRKRLYLVTVLSKLTSVYFLFFRAKRPFSSGAWTGWYDDGRLECSKPLFIFTIQTHCRGSLHHAKWNRPGSRKLKLILLQSIFGKAFIWLKCLGRLPRKYLVYPIDIRKENKEYLVMGWGSAGNYSKGGVNK